MRRDTEKVNTAAEVGGASKKAVNEMEGERASGVAGKASVSTGPGRMEGEETCGGMRAGDR